MKEPRDWESRGLWEDAGAKGKSVQSGELHDAGKIFARGAREPRCWAARGAQYRTAGHAGGAPARDTTAVLLNGCNYKTDFGNLGKRHLLLRTPTPDNAAAKERGGSTYNSNDSDLGKYGSPNLFTLVV